MAFIRKDGFTLFWGEDSLYSQMFPASFFLEGKTFYCAEQYYMYKKAQQFKDQRAMDMIMQLSDPKEQKQRGKGKNICGFQQEIWDQHSQDVVTRGTWAKVMY